jgi:hypothetical protein
MTSILALLVLLAAQTHEQLGDRFTHFAGYDLGKATLSEVQTRYGKSRVRESGDAGEYEAWICYTTHGAEIQFNSGEMGGGTALLGFTISATPTAKDCPKPETVMPSEISGVKLGISKNQFTALMKNSVEWIKNTGTARFDYQARTEDGVLLDVSISVIATFNSNKLTRLAVWKIEST